MPREIITIQIGQAGVQMGNALWELYCMEHGVTAEGDVKAHQYENNRIDTLFYETKDGRRTPRSIFMDLEPSVVDEVRTGCYKHLFNPNSIINGMEDAASNYARGFFNLGKRYIERLLSEIRKMVVHCDNFSLFEILNSYSGGTGSGLTSLLLEKLNDEYSKKYRFETGIFPSTTYAESTVGPYNALLYTHTTFENLDCGILVDNESLYTRLCNNLHYDKPTYNVLNRFLSQMLSCIFLSHRYQYQGTQHMDVDELMTNSIPYPRIHFPVLAYAPIVNNSQINHEKTRPDELTRQIFQPYSHFLTCPMHASKYISCCLLYRGQVSPSQVYGALAAVKADYNVQFVDWCPTGFKIGINGQPSMSTPNNILATSGESLCMLSGNIGIKYAWFNLRRKYYHLVSKRSFMHWFVGEGLEEDDFMEANEDIQVLENDYEEINRDTDVKSINVPIETIKTPTSNNNSKINQNNNINKNQNNWNDIDLIKQKYQATTSTKVIETITKNNNNNETSYCKMLYDDIVNKLDNKIQNTNKKMYKKLQKLQNKLNQFNQIYDYSPSTNEISQDSTLKNLCRLLKQKYPDGKALNEIQQIIRHKYQLNNLTKSHCETISCTPEQLLPDLYNDDSGGSLMNNDDIENNQQQEINGDDEELSSRVTTTDSLYSNKC